MRFGVPWLCEPQNTWTKIQRAELDMYHTGETEAPRGASALPDSAKVKARPTDTPLRILTRNKKN